MQNAKTLATYERHVAEYIAGTSQIVSGAAKIWLDSALSELPLTSKLFEIGSGHGRDAIYVRDRGYEVICTDATLAFLEHLRCLGLQAQYFNLLVDAFPSNYDLIIANSVLLHFNRVEFAAALAKISGALRANGRFAFSLKRGDSEEWSDHKLDAPRYFCYWQPEDLPAVLSKAGFSHWSIDIVTTETKRADSLFIIAQK